MKQITLRDIPDDIARAIEKKARKDKLSLNKTIISLLERTTGAAGRKKGPETSYHDLDHLSGAWSKSEADRFEKDLLSQRTIDEDLWKKTG